MLEFPDALVRALYQAENVSVDVLRTQIHHAEDHLPTEADMV